MSADKDTTGGTVPGQAEPVDAEFQPADPPEEKKARRERPKKRGPGWLFFYFIVLIAAAAGGLTAWSLQRWAGPLLTDLGLPPVFVTDENAGAGTDPELETRIAALEDREAPRSIDPDRLTEIEDRLDALEDRPESADETGADAEALADVREGLQAEIDSLAERIDALDAGSSEDGAAEVIEARLDEVRAIAAEAEEAARRAETAADSAASAAEQAREDDQGDALDLQSSYAELGEQVSSLRADMRRRLADAEQRASDTDTEFEAFAEDLASLRSSLQDASDRPAGGGDGLGARALAFAALADAARAGDPFSDELDALERVWPDVDPGALADHARSGAPSWAELAATAPAEAGRPREDDAADAEAGTERVFFGLVTVRRGDQAAAPAETGSARAAMQAGDFDAAIAAAEEAGADRWAADARARVEIDAALTEVRAALADSAAIAEPGGR